MKTKIESKISRIYLPAALLLGIGLLSVPAFFASAAEKSSFLLDGERLSPQKILILINRERVRSGLKPLKLNALLNRAAADKLADMRRRSYFGHTDPDGELPWKWLKKNGYDYSFAGENLAIGFDSAAKQHRAWMSSPTHRENILSSEYTQTGLAIGEVSLRKNRQETAVVQFFASPPTPLVQKSSPVPYRELAAVGGRSAQAADLFSAAPSISAQTARFWGNVFLAAALFVFTVGFGLLTDPALRSFRDACRDWEEAFARHFRHHSFKG